MRRAVANSRAVDESSPRVELWTSSDAEERITRPDPLVPTIDKTATGESFCDRHSFFLTTRYTTNCRVTDSGFPTMVQTEDSQQDVRDVVYVVLPGCTSDTSLGGAGFCSEPERFFYCECGKMNVVFGNEL
jgi:hypothetical protein